MTKRMHSNELSNLEFDFLANCRDQGGIPMWMFSHLNPESKAAVGRLGDLKLIEVAKHAWIATIKGLICLEENVEPPAGDRSVESYWYHFGLRDGDSHGDRDVKIAFKARLDEYINGDLPYLAGDWTHDYARKCYGAGWLDSRFALEEATSGAGRR